MAAFDQSVGDRTLVFDLAKECCRPITRQAVGWGLLAVRGGKKPHDWTLAQESRRTMLVCSGGTYGKCSTNRRIVTKSTLKGETPFALFFSEFLRQTIQC